MRPLALILVAALSVHPAAARADRTYTFYVLNQRTIALTAQYWNPILTYASTKSGVPLELKLARTAQEGNALAEAGKYDFQYTNHFFTPKRDRLGWKVIARPAGPGIESQIIVRVDSPVRSLRDLEGREVGFVSPDAFSGYWVPADALLRANVRVKPVFTGNQEASATQLRINKIAAAAVNSNVMARYGRRENFSYRVLWTSEVYLDLCIMANPKMPAEKVAAVKMALLGMVKDPVGFRILQSGAELLTSTSELGFVAADNHDYENYRRFYRTTKLEAERP